jgi:hypothetical protein
VTVVEAVVVLLSVPAGTAKASCRLHMTGWFAVILTDWPASMLGLVAGEMNCTPVAVVVVEVALPPPQLTISRQRTTHAPAR